MSSMIKLKEKVHLLRESERQSEDLKVKIDIIKDELRVIESRRFTVK